jgi:hypothetical protein
MQDYERVDVLVNHLLGTPYETALECPNCGEVLRVEYFNPKVEGGVPFADIVFDVRTCKDVEEDKETDIETDQTLTILYKSVPVEVEDTEEPIVKQLNVYIGASKTPYANVLQLASGKILVTSDVAECNAETLEDAKKVIEAWIILDTGGRM